MTARSAKEAGLLGLSALAVARRRRRRGSGGACGDGVEEECWRMAEVATWWCAREGGLKEESRTRRWLVGWGVGVVGEGVGGDGGGWVCRMCMREGEAAKEVRAEENWAWSLRRCGMSYGWVVWVVSGLVDAGWVAALGVVLLGSDMLFRAEIEVCLGRPASAAGARNCF